MLVGSGMDCRQPPASGCMTAAYVGPVTGLGLSGNRQLSNSKDGGGMRDDSSLWYARGGDVGVYSPDARGKSTVGIGARLNHLQPRLFPPGERTTLIEHGPSLAAFVGNTEAAVSSGDSGVVAVAAGQHLAIGTAATGAEPLRHVGRWSMPSRIMCATFTDSCPFVAVGLVHTAVFIVRLTLVKGASSASRQKDPDTLLRWSLQVVAQWNDPSFGLLSAMTLHWSPPRNTTNHRLSVFCSTYLGRHRVVSVDVDLLSGTNSSCPTTVAGDVALNGLHNGGAMCAALEQAPATLLLPTGSCGETVPSQSMHQPALLLATGGEDRRGRVVLLLPSNIGSIMDCAGDIPGFVGCQLRFHSGRIWALSLSPKRAVVATGSEDGSCAVWRLTRRADDGTIAGALVWQGLRLHGGHGVSRVVIGASGGCHRSALALYTGGFDGTVYRSEVACDEPGGEAVGSSKHTGPTLTTYSVESTSTIRCTAAADDATVVAIAADGNVTVLFLESRGHVSERGVARVFTTSLTSSGGPVESEGSEGCTATAVDAQWMASNSLVIVVGTSDSRAHVIVVDVADREDVTASDITMAHTTAVRLAFSATAEGQAVGQGSAKVAAVRIVRLGVVIVDAPRHHGPVLFTASAAAGLRRVPLLVQCPVETDAKQSPATVPVKPPRGSEDIVALDGIADLSTFRVVLGVVAADGHIHAAVAQLCPDGYLLDSSGLVWHSLRSPPTVGGPPSERQRGRGGRLGLGTYDLCRIGVAGQQQYFVRLASSSSAVFDCINFDLSAGAPAVGVHARHQDLGADFARAHEEADRVDRVGTEQHTTRASTNQSKVLASFGRGGSLFCAAVGDVDSTNNQRQPVVLTLNPQGSTVARHVVTLPADGCVPTLSTEAGSLRISKASVGGNGGSGKTSSGNIRRNHSTWVSPTTGAAVVVVPNNATRTITIAGFSAVPGDTVDESCRRVCAGPTVCGLQMYTVCVLPPYSGSPAAPGGPRCHRLLCGGEDTHIYQYSMTATGERQEADDKWRLTHVYKTAHSSNVQVLRRVCTADSAARHLVLSAGSKGEVRLLDTARCIVLAAVQLGGLTTRFTTSCLLSTTTTIASANQAGETEETVAGSAMVGLGAADGIFRAVRVAYNGIANSILCDVTEVTLVVDGRANGAQFGNAILSSCMVGSWPVIGLTTGVLCVLPLASSEALNAPIHLEGANRAPCITAPRAITVQGHQSGVNALCSSPGWEPGKTIVVSGGDDQGIIIWEAPGKASSVGSAETTLGPGGEKGGVFQRDVSLLKLHVLTSTETPYTAGVRSIVSLRAADTTSMSSRCFVVLGEDQRLCSLQLRCNADDDPQQEKGATHRSAQHLVPEKGLDSTRVSATLTYLSRTTASCPSGMDVGPVSLYRDTAPGSPTRERISAWCADIAVVGQGLESLGYCYDN